MKVSPPCALLSKDSSINIEKFSGPIIYKPISIWSISVSGKLQKPLLRIWAREALPDDSVILDT